MSHFINSIRHKENSLICSLDDDVGANDRLFNLGLTAARWAMTETVDIPEHARSFGDARWANVYPGEHYRLLKSIVKLLEPEIAVEVGTFTGLGAATVLQGMSKGVLHTYDILPWNSFNTYLTQKDFDLGGVVQHLADLSDPKLFDQHRQLLNQAKLIFIDAPKDGVFEYKFMPLLASLDVMPGRTLFIDDIRFMNMIECWRRIKSPKLDMTSFGHWSGSGIVDVSNGLRWQN